MIHQTGAMPRRNDSPYSSDEQHVLGSEERPEKLLQMAQEMGNRAACAVALDLIRRQGGRGNRGRTGQ